MIAIQLQHVTVVKCLVLGGANVNVTFQGGSSALMKAAQKESLEIVQCLCENGADVNYIRLEDSADALVMASYCGHVETVKYLLSRGATQDQSLSMALEIATEEGHTDVVAVLQPLVTSTSK